MQSSPSVSLLSRIALVPALLIAFTGCVSTASRDTVIVEPAGSFRSVSTTSSAQAEADRELPDEEFSELMAIMRHDLTRSSARELERKSLQPSRAAHATEKAPSLPAIFSSLPMPVAGLTGRDIQDNFGFPRDGGRRRHRGIDIFAPRGTPVIAVVDGNLTYIGDQKKGGRCVWLVNEEGYSFYYAHFDRWAPGIYEGMRVKRGDVIGFVGTTGNAVGTPPHLHFQVSHQDETVNPYPLLRAYSGDAVRPNPVLSGGFSTGAMDK